jgi:hypothetical protein
VITTHDRILETTEERHIYALELVVNTHTEYEVSENDEDDDLTLFESLASRPEL